MTILCIDNIKGKVGRVIRFEGDESCSGNGQLIEFREEIVDFRFLSSHLIKVLSGDGTTTGSEGQNKFCVVEGEDDVCNLGVAILLTQIHGQHALSDLLVLLILAIKFLKSILSRLCFLNPMVEFSLDIILELFLEFETRSSLHIAFRSLPLVVFFLFDGEFDGEIASSHSGDIPFNHLDLAALELGANRDSEGQADKHTSGDGKSNLVVLLTHGSFGLLTRVLHEEGRLLGVAFWRAGTVLEERRDAVESEEFLREANGRFEFGLDVVRVGVAPFVGAVIHANVLVLHQWVDTVVEELANLAVRAVKVELADFRRD